MAPCAITALGLSGSGGYAAHAQTLCCLAHSSASFAWRARPEGGRPVRACLPPGGLSSSAAHNGSLNCTSWGSPRCSCSRSASRTSLLIVIPAFSARRSAEIQILAPSPCEGTLMRNGPLNPLGPEGGIGLDPGGSIRISLQSAVRAVLYDCAESKDLYLLGPPDLTPSHNANNGERAPRLPVCLEPRSINVDDGWRH